MIQVKKLSKYYGPAPAIRDVSFHVEKGEILGLLGPNGAGKTTTMRIITGFLPATSGTAQVAGFDVSRESLEVRKRLGYLPETVPLYPDLTPLDYLEFVAKLKGIARAEREERIDEVIELCRIGDVADKLIGKLSKGYRQRVGIAQALIHDPDVLILDEPTVGLDPKQIIEMRQLIKELGGERSIILSTHILPEVSMTCNRVVIVSDGCVVAEDTPENLTRRLRGSERIYLEVVGPAEAVETKLKGLEHVLHVEKEAGEPGVGRFVVESALGKDVRARLAAAVVGAGWDLLEMRPMGMSLEEIFLKLTTKEEAA